MNKGKMAAAEICLIALAICINYAGGQLALLLRLPIYLDSMGTILIACIYGPVTGLLTPLISGMLMALTGDIYSLYFAPVGMILGLTAGIVLRNNSSFGWKLVLSAFLITIPGTIVSSVINAVLFGGITSSGSTVLVQALSHTPLGLTGSIFAVQILTDFLDRVISLYAVMAVLRVPVFRANWNNG
ncbi:ECF transporter S component [[Clostridium] aminophilum]|uniref:ECF transporter S component n=1 Tax=[Clostridium] aminophilum TaxID=1526 RepID=UPI0026EEE6BE|nr:ECF transporter S component [[Clostridium] aminophilum]MDD6195316.1 ECF transporter S component [[Clostridium] aminophilum]